MKKIFLVSALTLIAGLIFVIMPERFTFLWGFQLLALPLLSGVMMVLVQDEDKSYRFIPKLVVGSVVTSFLFVLVLQLVDSLSRGFLFGYPKSSIIGIAQLSLVLVVICLFGGLIGIVIRGSSLLLKKYLPASTPLVAGKILGFLFFIVGVLATLIFALIFIALLYPKSYLLNFYMVDFKPVELIGLFRYYALIICAFVLVAVPAVLTAILGALVVFPKKIVFKISFFAPLILLFFISFSAFMPLSSYLETRHDERKAEMKNSWSERYYDVDDFDSINVSRFVRFDEIKIIQGDVFSVVAKGSDYDKIGLAFERSDDGTLYVKRSEFESYYNTDIWKVENKHQPFPGGTKHLSIEITMPNLKRLEISGGNVELADLDVDGIEIKLNKRFNNIKGSVKVRGTLSLDAKGGIIDLSGSAKDLAINSGDCWIEMNKLHAENATITAKNTSRLNVNVSGDMKILSGDNSGIENHYGEDVSEEYKTDFYDIKVRYPNDSLDKEELVRKFVEQEVELRKKDWSVGGSAYEEEKRVESDFPDRPKMVFTYDIDYRVFRSKRMGTVSYLLTIGEYAGGANANETVKAFTFNDDGLVGLSSVLNIKSVDGKMDSASAKNLRELSSRLYKKTINNKKTFPDTQIAEDGLGLNKDAKVDSLSITSLLSNFVLTNDGLVFYFDKGVITIRAAGVVGIDLSWKDLDAILVKGEDETNLPDGYSLDKYTITEILNTDCSDIKDCETPFEYAVRSNCPYKTLCLSKKCTVVCPEMLK